MTAKKLQIFSKKQKSLQKNVETFIPTSLFLNPTYHILLKNILPFYFSFLFVKTPFKTVSIG